MDQFVTTYRKDFLWPYVRTFGFKPDFGGSSSVHGGEMCPCQCRHSSSDGRSGSVPLIGPNVYQQESFQQSGPNAPLLDPKLYPARVGPPPEADTQRFDQPNIFLEKLKLKYPFLYEVLRTAPPDDMITRINRDRLRTTYQVDICHMNEYPAAPYDELIRAAGVSGTSPCGEPIRLPGDICRPREKVGFHPGVKHDTKFVGFGAKCGGGRDGGFGGPGLENLMIMGQTEYQDAICKLGELIIKDKIHHKGRRRN